MKKLIKPSIFNGTITAPASKSMMQRAIAASLLAETPLTLTNPTYCNDSRAALDVIQRLGATVSYTNDTLHICGQFAPGQDVLHFGESGLGIRMFAPIAALANQPLTLTGAGSLLKRPVTMIEEPLRQLGGAVSTTQGLPPLTICGPLTGGAADVDGSVSSQFLTGLLMALPKAHKDSRLTVRNLQSTPYIDMTLALLTFFQITVTHEHYQTFYIPGQQRYLPRQPLYWIEGDWSGAAFLLVAGAIGGEVTIKGLDAASTQADRKILAVLHDVGAEVTITNDLIRVKKNYLRAFQCDAVHCPDLFPPLVALACLCTGKSIITGVERLIHKESNRADALFKEFSALGAHIHVSGNTMEITGGTLHGGEVDSHNDHRIAMAAAIAASQAQQPVTINQAECVAKSYPNFFEDFVSIGGVSA